MFDINIVCHKGRVKWYKLKYKRLHANMCGKEGHQRLRDWESIGVFIPDILASIGVFTPNILVISALFYFTIYVRRVLLYQLMDIPGCLVVAWIQIFSIADTIYSWLVMIALAYIHSRIFWHMHAVPFRSIQENAWGNLCLIRPFLLSGNLHHSQKILTLIKNFFLSMLKFSIVSKLLLL